MQTDKIAPQPMQLTPVGVVRSSIKTPMLEAGDSGLSLTHRMDKIKAYHRQVEATVCELVIEPQWGELLDGIEDFSHVLVLYWPHLIDPARPNPVLVSAVRLVARKDNVLEVKGFEAVDGQPHYRREALFKELLTGGPSKSARVDGENSSGIGNGGLR